MSEETSSLSGGEAVHPSRMYECRGQVQGGVGGGEKLEPEGKRHLTLLQGLRVHRDIRVGRNYIRGGVRRLTDKTGGGRSGTIFVVKGQAIETDHNVGECIEKGVQCVKYTI